jgi:hypothetical protein
MRFIKTILAALTFTAFASAPCFAQTGPDFIFNVPVNFDNVPSLNGHSFSVHCQVLVRGADGRSSGYGNTAVGGRHPTYDIGPTGYHGAVRVEVTLPAGVRRADANFYSCSASFYTVTNAAGARVSMPNANQYTALTGQAVARSQLLVQGPITP